jgi:hypothetical protein
VIILSRGDEYELVDWRDQGCIAGDVEYSSSWEGQAEQMWGEVESGYLPTFPRFEG